MLTSFGVLAGLVGTDLLLIMMLLAARLPAIDRAFGHDSAMALHQSFGKPALSLILAHAGLVIVGYALAYRQVTVFARDIVTADVLAVLRDGSLLATPGLRAASA
ncbi:hypothetical protein E3O62_07205 [Cryobacterium sp. TMT2-15-1]|uniref:hypothetical protein n=1 Tax=Cryobacterium sp. TMT2-15-1 TaxID=1259246 RepID=UPI0010699C3F|nr:hypothetical protein [Cryobacterium sp. TMT2-15-1]TFC60477.1 hypothetical protein E3O62_07205 [Cryobacterium sp. TMT2-15-1]